MDLTQRIALVTGAGSGIGRAIAVGLAEAGAGVVLVGRGEEALQQTAQTIADGGRQAWVRAADIRTAPEVDTLVEETLREQHAIDILVNAAGIFPAMTPLAETRPADWDDTLATNLRGPYLLTRAVLAGMLERDFGRIVNITAPMKHLPKAAAYSASKAALDSLTKSTAYELRDTNVRVNGLEPPLCDTGMHEGGADPACVVPTLLELVDPEPGLRTGRLVKVEA